jgi:hypothetical protein
MTPHRRRGALVAALATVLLAAGAGPALAGPRAATSDYGARLARAVDACADAARTQARFVDCVGDLAAPDPTQPREADIWNVFLNCVAEWYRALDESTPPKSDVNDCLEDHGVDVGP